MALARLRLPRDTEVLIPRGAQTNLARSLYSSKRPAGFFDSGMLQLESKRFLFVRAISREREAPSKKRQSQKSGQNFVAPGSVADKSRPRTFAFLKGISFFWK